MHFDCFAQRLWQGVMVQEEVGRVQLDVVARHIPDAFVLAALAPRVLHHVVGFSPMSLLKYSKASPIFSSCIASIPRW